MNHVTPPGFIALVVAAVVAVEVLGFTALVARAAWVERQEAIARRRRLAAELAALGYDVRAPEAIAAPDSPVLLDTAWNTALAQLLAPTEAREETRT
jgi:hypothetical protein